MPNPRATYRTIAREAGVSAVTVSLALHNNPRIPESTRERIHQIAKHQGYRADPNIAKLMHHLRMRRRKNISSNLVALQVLEGGSVSYAARVLAGARERAEMLGYSLETIDLKASDLSAARLEKILRSRGVEGIILLPIPTRDMTDELNWSRFSVVATSHSILRPHFNTVVPNQFDNMMRLCEKIESSYGSRFGFVTAITHDLRVNHRFTSAYLWQRTFGGKKMVPPLLIDAEAFDGPSFLQWVREHDLQVVVTEQGLMATIRQHLPESAVQQIKWIYTGLTPDGVGLSGIIENQAEVGRAAIDLLAAMIQRGERGIPEFPRCMEIRGTVTLELIQAPAD